MSSKYRVTKGFKFHARPQTGAYSCSFFTELVLLSLYDTEFILFHRVLLSFYDTEFIFLDTELVLFFICSDLINFIFILLAFHLSCTVVSGSWI